ncbi:hypothetical protein GUJ93_ZPchr0005g14499 [Zizania palustris]|uniref:Uncharacterized protein n=1 Tax=Zizania palustris TaxID=103762 RepID=A0A8J5SMH6_ZIZPA|nr:hypothetical protein GUJ93_ZPchr0005g14499 [Zizania palustris]
MAATWWWGRSCGGTLMVKHRRGDRDGAARVASAERWRRRDGGSRRREMKAEQARRCGDAETEAGRCRCSWPAWGGRGGAGHCWGEARVAGGFADLLRRFFLTSRRQPSGEGITGVGLRPSPI